MTENPQIWSPKPLRRQNLIYKNKIFYKEKKRVTPPHRLTNPNKYILNNITLFNSTNNLISISNNIILLNLNNNTCLLLINDLINGKMLALRGKLNKLGGEIKK